MSEEELSKGFVGILENHATKTDTFRPRDVRLNAFVYIDDEKVDKGNEVCGVSFEISSDK